MHKNVYLLFQNPTIKPSLHMNKKGWQNNKTKSINLEISKSINLEPGEGGIRTRGTIARTTH